MALSMASMAGLRGSSPAALQSNRRGRTAVARTGFSVRASSAETETETSRRAMLGLVATGIVSGSFVQAVLAEPPKNEPFGALAASSDTIFGGWTPIENPKAPEVVKIAEFAVKEHNKEAGTSLVLESVIKGKSQVVEGINYDLVISAKDGPGRPSNYAAFVYSRLPPKSPELISFIPLYT